MTLRCPACRSRRATFTSMVAHIKATGHTWCDCGGPAFEGGLTKHRPGTRCCKHHPFGHIHLAMRFGATDEEVLDMILETVLETPGKPVQLCPF